MGWLCEKNKQKRKGNLVSFEVWIIRLSEEWDLIYIIIGKVFNFYESKFLIIS